MRDAMRIMDASANRAREAMRVMEDAARFLLDDAELAGELKAMRHALREALTAHCGSCCREDREDCSCPPRGCANVVHETDCEDVGQEH